MDKLVREQIRAWKAGMEEMNLVILQEKRARTPAERFLLLQVFINEHGQIGIARRNPESRLHRMPYSEIQERILARKSRRI